jgi:hypothetical protein
LYTGACLKPQVLFAKKRRQQRSGVFSPDSVRLVERDQLGEVAS